MNIEEKGLAAGFKTAGEATSYIHLSESHRGVPGTGSVDWDGAFASLKATAFDGDLVIESFVTLPAEIASALSVWRPVAKDRYEVLDRGVPFLRDSGEEARPLILMAALARSLPPVSRKCRCPWRQPPGRPRRARRAGWIRY